MLTSRDELVTLERDYRTWVAALLALAPSRPALIVEILKKYLQAELGLSKKADLPEDLVPLPDTVKKWATRGSIPADPVIRRALVRAVEESGLDRPKGLASAEKFSWVLNRLVQLRAQSPHWDLGMDEDRELFSSGALRFPVQTVQDLDLEHLGLGSFLFEGKVPPYVNRAAEKEVLNFFENQSSGILVIEGPPKSGKTRLLIEAALSSKSARHMKTYWISSLDGALGSFLKTVGNRRSRQRLIVLDDLQQFKLSLHTEDLNLRSLSKLAEHGRVVITKHSSPRFRFKHSDFFDSLRSEKSNKANFSSTAETVSFVELPEELDETELDSTMRVLDRLLTREQASHLGAFLSSGRELLAIFLDSRDEDLLGEAIFSAVIDARILYRHGFSKEELRILARTRLQSLSPNAAWSDLVFEQRLLRLTIGVTPKSPHAILKWHAAEEKFRLFDYIWSELGLEDWSLPRLDGLLIDLNESSRNAASLGFFDLSWSLNQKRLEEIPDDDLALGIWADLLLQRADYSSACEKAELAIKVNPFDWRHYRILSRAHRLAGEIEKSSQALRRGLQKIPTSYDLFIELLPMLVSMGKERDALEVTRQFPEQSYPSRLAYFMALSSVQGSAGNHEDAISTILEGLEYFENDCGLTANLSLALEGNGETLSALTALEGHNQKCEKACLANQALVNNRITAGDLDSAQQLLEHSSGWLENREFSAVLLASLAFAKGDYAVASGLFNEANGLGFDPSHFANEANSLFHLERFEDAKRTVQNGMVLYPQDPGLLNLMGNLQLELGDRNEAATWYEKATLGVRPSFHPFFNLARMRATEGEATLALALYEKGLEFGGSPEDYDLWMLARVTWELGNYSKSAEFSRERFENGGLRQGLEWLLACLTYQQGISYMESLPEGLSDLFWVQLALAERHRLQGGSNLNKAWSLILRNKRQYPKNLEICFLAGSIALEIGQLEAALSSFKSCRALEDTKSLTVTAEIYQEAVEISLKRSEESKYISGYHRERFEGTDSEFYEELTFAHLFAKNYQIAQKAISEGLQQSPDSQSLLNVKAVLHREMGQRLDSIAIFRRSLELDSSRENALAALWLVQELADASLFREAKKVGEEYLGGLPVALPPQQDLQMREQLEFAESRLRTPTNSSSKKPLPKPESPTNVAAAAREKFSETSY